MESIILDSQKGTGGAQAGAESMLQQISNTPLEPINLMIEDKQRKVYLKLEGTNLTGSMKVRTGLALIHHLTEQGRLHANSVIIESTSGNLGVALAFLCQQYGYQFVAVIDPKTTPENIQKMRAYNAQIELVDQQDHTGGYLLSRLAHIQELCQQRPEYVWTDQYACLANPDIHYKTTAPEVYQQMQELVGAVFVPVSTGGTLAGIGRYFREVSPTTQIIGVDAWGSVAFGGMPAPRKLTGIGSSRLSSFITRHAYDLHLLVKDEEAFAFCRALFHATGIKVGGSSGATLAACARHLRVQPELEHIVCICADGGDNYNSSIFSDAWLEQHGFQVNQTFPDGVEGITMG